MLGEQALQVSAIGRSTAAVRSVTGHISATFQDRCAEAAEADRQLPTREMVQIRSRIDSLTNALAQIRDQRDLLAEVDDTARPLEFQSNIVNDLSDAQDRVVAMANEIRELSAHLDTLRSTPPPSSGVVEAEERTAALAADVALQQDLSELAVALTEQKAQLLDVWQRSAASLDAAAGQAEKFVSALSELDGYGSGNPPLGEAATVRTQVHAYENEIQRFRAEWTTELGSLRSVDVDAMSSRLPERHTLLRRRLADFRLHSAKALAAIEAAINEMGSTAQNLAQHHVVLSRLRQQFVRLAHAHRQLLAAAQTIEPEENFRLDAPTRAARGLRRRTQARIEKIDALLAEQAVERACARHRTEMVHTERLLSELTLMQQDAMSALLAKQVELIESLPSAYKHVRDATTLSTIHPIMVRLDSALAELGNQESHLAQQRDELANQPPVRLSSLVVRERKSSLRHRAFVGGVAALAAFVALAVTQLSFRRYGP